MPRVLVVDDSAVARTLLKRVLEREPDFEIAGEAVDGRAAVAAAVSLRPDVVVMDVQMPEMDGLEATKEIMRRSPAPIVLVTAGQNRSEVDMSFAALEAGALAMLDKPRLGVSPDDPGSVAEFVRTVRMMAEVRVVGRRFDAHPKRRQNGDLRRARGSGVEVVAIGASTGGPSALATILRDLPADLRVPVLVVQHIGPGFDEGLVKWLGAGSPLPVRLAAAGRHLGPGEVHVSPHDRHLGMAGNMLTVLSDAEPVGGHRPSATYLFRSIADAGISALGVILTGMGEDGVQGLVELKEAGGLVVAQDEATSVVYGMPGRAVELGLVDAVLPVDGIAAAIASATAPVSPSS